MNFKFIFFTLVSLLAVELKAQNNGQGALVDALVRSLEVNNLLYLYDGDTLYINVNDPANPGMYYYANEIIKARPAIPASQKPEYYLNLDVKTNNKVDFNLKNLENYHGYFTLSGDNDELVVADLQYIITTN